MRVGVAWFATDVHGQYTAPLVPLPRVMTGWDIFVWGAGCPPGRAIRYDRVGGAAGAGGGDAERTVERVVELASEAEEGSR
jgi:hypothetical protein